MQFILHNFKANLMPALLRVFALTLLLGIVLGQIPALKAQAAGEPKLILTKSIEGGATTAKVGDVIRYRIRFECSSLVDPCGELVITDVLQAGLTYQGPPSSSVPAGFTITESGGTITIRKTDNMLLDGSQYDAVIAVKVDYDLRNLPQDINNRINGTIDPPGPITVQTALPADALPVTISGLNPSWGLTKTLFSPSINPTVDTDVTYQIQLCPTGVSGNVSLQNIVITDTLPTNAIFVSASDGGDGTTTPGIVTWNIAGPVTPPACATRYVTINYPKASFPIGTSITNSASSTADYLDSFSNICINCIGITPVTKTHPVDLIKDVPSYGKSDVGDPVGMSGTARFVLSLNTNGTNYPSNEVMLIDNLLPDAAQLEVTTVTSGQWSEAFDYVRAYAEYSTDNGVIWTQFPDPVGKPQPAEYNESAVYTAPVTNITNVRWRFEYDSDRALPFDLATTKQGLPYTWSFTSNPEVRVKPRLVSAFTTETIPTELLPAVSGTTYTNCVQVSRVDGDPITPDPVIDPCKTEGMKVQGDFVSLRTSKDEIPGMPWDDMEDPNIKAFVSDFNILPGDTLKYTLIAEVTERSSAPLIDPTILDTLPDDLIFVRDGDVRYIDGATTTVLTKNTGTGGDYTFAEAGSNPGVGHTLKWDFNYQVNQKSLGSRFLEVDFYARIPRGQVSGARINKLYVVTDSVDVLCEINGTQSTDTDNIDGNNNPSSTEVACKTEDSYIVERSAALRGEKWIRSVTLENSQVVRYDTFLPPAGTTADPACPNGLADGLIGSYTVGVADSTNNFTRYPCISRAFPQYSFINNQFVPPPTDPTLDDFEYNLRIFNDGNVGMIKYVLYDILPYYGDKGSGGTLAESARNSQFRPALRGPVQLITPAPGGLTDANFSIEYNLTTNPCRPEVFNTTGAVPSGCDNNWSSTWSAAARSYRIRLIESPTTSIPPSTTSSEVRFGVPMNIPADVDPIGTFNSDDPQSKEIAWNSFAHVGSYTDLTSTIKDLLASEPRKVGISIPEMMSIGNRVWRDSDNSGTINAPDDTDPGIGGVIVNLYRDADGNGVPDGAAIATTTTDTGYTDTVPNPDVYHDGGYYLFSNIPYNTTTPLPGTNNNRYIVGIPEINFLASDPDGAGPLTQGALYTLRSSTGTPADTKYTTLPVDANVDKEDHGRDPAVLNKEVFSPPIILNPDTELSSEADLSDNDRDGPAGTRRGVNGEANTDSDLTVDFGFFGGTDVPFSIGNYLWFDNGATAGHLNNGIRDTDELPVAKARVELYRDGNGNGKADGNEYIRFDVTDAPILGVGGGFYLFDNLDPGTYFVLVAPGNFTNTFDPDGSGTTYPLANGVLRGWYSSQVTGTENATFGGAITTAAIDSDDNGIDTNILETNGVFSSAIVLTRIGTPGYQPEPSGETHLSGQADPGPATNANFNPTGWDGINSRGRYLETDASSNLTIDFGFIPPMSLGNRVWIDDGTTASGVVLSQFNNGIMDGNELGKAGVRVELWRDTNNNTVLNSGEFVRYTTTDASGYYLFDKLQPASNYFIHIPASNFAAEVDPDGAGPLPPTTPAGPLFSYLSSSDTTPPDDNPTDKNDNGIDKTAPITDGITSQVIEMKYSDEPLTPGDEKDISTDTAKYGTNNVGIQGQADNNSNLTQDFGFVLPPRSLGNYLWLDTGDGNAANLAYINNGIFNIGESAVPTGVKVSLYLDANGDNQPDDLGILGTFTDDAIAADTTDTNGYYLFDKLPSAKYIVGVDRENFDTGGKLAGYTSSTNNVDNAENINNFDSRDNGIDRELPGDATTSPHGILSTSIDLTANPLVDLPTVETGSLNAADGPNYRGNYGETDENSDLTIDFGFVEAYALGNRVWFDTDNDGLMDVDLGIPANSEQPISGVEVALYHADASGAPTTAVMVNGVARTEVTDANGYYLFDYLAPGDYVVVITAANFNDTDVTDTTTALVGYWSSRTTISAAGVVTEILANTPDPDFGLDNAAGGGDDDVDLDDNGTRQTSGIFSNAVISKAVSLGLTGPTEPTNDDDLQPTVLHGNQPDDRSNLSVDFGFYQAEIGNLVYEDINVNGTYDDGLTALINGATVHLYSQNGTEIPVGPDGILGAGVDDNSGVLTGSIANSWAGGEYHFSGLPAGDYIVKVVTPAGMISTIDGGNPLNAAMQDDNDDPDDHLDNNDNGDGIGTGTAGVVSAATLTMTAGEFGANAAAITTDNTVDFGFVKAYSLGNRVWFDTNNNGILNALEVGVNGVRVELYLDNGTTGGTYDPASAVTPDTFVGFTTTVANSGANGYYRFDNLFPGDYIVVLPADNFRNLAPGTDNVAADPLKGYWSTGTYLDSTSGTVKESATNDPDNDRDAFNGTIATSDENGVTTFDITNKKIDYVASMAITLGGVPLEPTLEANPATNPETASGEAPDDHSNRTVDFGFYRVAIGDLVFMDANQNGTYLNNPATGEIPISGALVHLYVANNTTEIITGKDGIPGTADDTLGPDGVSGGGDDNTGGIRTSATGVYLFSGLPAGDYIIKVDGPIGTVSTIDTFNVADSADPDTKINNNDNGIGVSSGTVSANPLTMAPGEVTATNSSGTTTDLTVDFGFTELVAIGNRVWFDTGTGAGGVANDGIMNGTEVGVPDGVVVELYTSANVKINVGPDGIRSTADDLTGDVTTATVGTDKGFYKFDNLLPGDYYVKIPASEFAAGRPLYGYVSTTGAGANETSDQTADENGIDGTPVSPLTTAGIKTQNFTLTPNTEQTAENQANYTLPDNKLDDNNVNFTADFGFVEAYTLGNRVWYDTDNDGIMNGAEQPIDGVEVKLYRADASGNPINVVPADTLDTDVTANGGYYLFDNLAPGNYVVVVTADNFDTAGINKLVGYWSSRTTMSAAGVVTENAADTPDPDANGTDTLPNTGDDDVDVDDNGTRTTLAGFVGAVVSKPVTLGPSGLSEPTDEDDATQKEATVGDGLQPDGRSNLKVDFGFYRTAIGNLVFEDVDLNGKNDSEPIIANVPVYLYNANNAQILIGADGILGTVDDGTTNPFLTDALGKYLFTGLPEGSYIVKIVAPIGGISTVDTSDSIDTSNPTTNTDDNDNGVGEGTGTITSSTTNPLITNPGSTGAAGKNTVDQLTGTTTDPTVDFGIVPGYGLGNRVWFDTNNNGVMDGAENGVQNVVVNLYAANIAGNPIGSILATDTTNTSGFYLFDDLFPRDYVVVINKSNFASGGALAGYWSSGTVISGGVPVENLAPAAPAPDPDTDLDIDDNGTRNTTADPVFGGAVISKAVSLGGVTPEPIGELAAQLESGVLGNQGNQPDARANMTVDFGFYQVSIGNLVYEDINVNGTYNSGGATPDTLLNGVTVHLYSQDGTEIPVGPDGILGVGVDNTSGVVTGSVANSWPAGEYHFSGLPAGDYIVKVEPPTGTNSTIDTFAPLDGSATGDPDTHTDDNDNGVGQGSTTVSSNVLTMSGGEVGMFNDATGITTDNTLDFGFVSRVAIGNRVWFDTGVGVANDGILNGTEVGVNGVTVQLFSTGADGVMGGGDDTLAGTTSTVDDSLGAPGYYQFDNLYPGKYYIHLPVDNFTVGGVTDALVGYVSSVGNGGVNDNDDQNADENGIDSTAANPLTTAGIVSPVYTLIAGTEPTTTSTPADEHTPIYTGSLTDANVNFTADFGFVQLVAIGNRVWIDDGAGLGFADDGIQNGGELGIDGVRVELYRQGQTAGTDIPVAFTSTSGGGNYVFDNLVPDDYFIHIPNDNFGDVTSDIVPGNPLAGYLSSKGAGANETSDQTPTVLYPTADENGIDAVSTATAPITAGVSSNVFTLSHNGETTDDNETGYGGILGDSSVNFTADFGFVQKVALGNIVWLDNGAGGGIANNGKKDGSELGIPNVDLALYHVGDTPGVTLPVATTSTNPSGYYVFDNLLPGQYFVFIPGTEFGTGQSLVNLLSSTGAGADESTDQTGDENGIDNAAPATNGIRSMAYDLQPNTEPSSAIPVTDDNDTGYNGALDDDNVNFTADFGFTELVAIGNRVWKDTGTGAFYNDGILDGAEAGVDGVTVELHGFGYDGLESTADDITDSVITSGGGYYQFDNLYPGKYYIKIPFTQFDTPVTDPLYGYVSSLGGGVPALGIDDDDDQTADENGIDGTTANPLTTAGIVTPVYTLMPNTEPSGENQSNYSLPANKLDDDNVNFTADLGFVQLVAIGNRVWYDIGGGGGGVAKDGIQNGSEAGASGVRVELYFDTDNNTVYNPGVDLHPAANWFTITDASGNYAFDNLIPGKYFVHIPASEFTTGGHLIGFASSPDTVQPPKDESSDQSVSGTNPIADENGIDAGDLPLNGITTQVFTLTPNTETINDNQASYNGYLDNDNVNFTADFGFVNIVAIGNRIWKDTGAGANSNNGILDADEVGVNGVTVQLWTDPNGDGNKADGVQIGSTITTVDDAAGNPGYYVFDNLLAGKYVVYIPATNFDQTTDPLYSYYSTEDDGTTDETTDNLVGGDENGVDNPTPAAVTGGGITSTMYDLSAGTEPTTDEHAGVYSGVLNNNDVNLTADFGFVQKYTLGNRVWFDTNDNALMEIDPLFPTDPTKSEIGVNGVTVQLWTDPNNDDNPSDGVKVGSDITTANGGYYLFDNIYPGNYVVVIPPSNFSGAGKLAGYWSSLTSMGATGITAETDADDPDLAQGIPGTSDDDEDLDDNGTRSALASVNFNGAVISKTVSIGPSGNTEPTDETDVNTLETGADHQGSQPNDRANMKVDFGFYKVSVGDLVFSDGVKDGTYVSIDDAILPGVLVHLFASNGTTATAEIFTGADGIPGTADDLLGPDGKTGGTFSADDGDGGMYTDPSGEYLFSGLPRGTYVITVDSPIGTSSTIDNGTTSMQDDNDDANNNLDNNDNGDGTGNGTVSSAPVTLTPGLATTNNTVTNSDGSTHNPTLDFGFIPAFSLGNRVWFDTNNLGTIDLLEIGINGVTVALYHTDASDNPTTPFLVGGVPLTEVTHSNGAGNDGYYLFNNLPADNYVVVIPSSNFASGAVLDGYWSSSLKRNDDDTFTEINLHDPDVVLDDSDDNGMYRPSDGDVVSKPITLGPNPMEPINEADLDISLLDVDRQGQPDNRGNMTVDFGFYTINLGNLVWEDLDNSGNTTNATVTEVGINNVVVELWTADGLTRLDTVTTNTDATLGDGFYLFSGLPKGNYLVRIPNTEFEGAETLVNYASSTGTNDIISPVEMGTYEAAPSPDDDLNDNDDNGTETGGTLGAGGYIQTKIFDLSPFGELSYDNADGSTSEPRVDFGVFRQDAHDPIIGIAKNLVSSSEVSPGTYQVIYDILVMNMGDVPLNSVQVTDDLSATFTAPTTASLVSISAVGLTINPLYDGDINTLMLKGTDSLAIGTFGTIRLTVNVIPYKSGPFDNTAIASGINPFGGAKVTDNSEDDPTLNPDPNGDKDPTNDNDPTPVDFGPGIFDPPIGFKVFNAVGLPELQWTMTWINSTNIAAVNSRVSDPIPADTTYVASGAPSGYALPAGVLPAGTTDIGVSCTSPSAATTTTLCYYEGPTAGNLLGRIVWEGTLGPDFGHTTAATAVNELNITFRVSVPSNISAVYNIATIDTDLDGGGSYVPGELVVANSQAIWVRPVNNDRSDNKGESFRPGALPNTGFAPGVVSILPEQHASEAYYETGGIWLEVPRLGINTSVVGIPQAKDGTWNVSWLWEQTGWLQGTSYPTLNGNSAITGHVYLPNGKPGPFVDINKLAYGDKIIIHAFGQKYIYEVRENKQVRPSDTSVLNNKDKAWVTLITCLGYNETNNTYASRVAVNAILITVEEEKKPVTQDSNR